jgi:hypothetical protein
MLIPLTVVSLLLGSLEKATLFPEDTPSTGSAATTANGPALSNSPSWPVHLGVAAAAGVVSVPAGFMLATALGNTQIYLAPTALLGLTAMGLLAPLLVSLVSWGFSNWLNGDRAPRFGFWGGFAATFVVHLIATVVAGFAGVNVAAWPGLLVLSLLDGVAMAGANVAVSRWLQAASAPTVISSPVSSVSATTVVRLSEFAF